MLPDVEADVDLPALGLPGFVDVPVQQPQPLVAEAPLVIAVLPVDAVSGVRKVGEHDTSVSDASARRRLDGREDVEILLEVPMCA